MIFYSEEDITPVLKKSIQELIGNHISIADQIKKGTVGSSLYRLRYFSFFDTQAELIDLNSRCTFEKFEKGLLLRINDRQKLYFVAFSFGSIENIELIKGEEHINPIPLSPMGLLLKLGVHIRHARHFMIKLLEYSVDPMVLKIQLGNENLQLDGNGYNYYREVKYFNRIHELCQGSGS